MSAETEVQTVTLESLAGGAALELFKRELDRVVANIADPNTASEAPREIVLKIKFKPSKKSRETVAVGVYADAKLAPVLPPETTVYVGRRRGRGLICVESDYRQRNLFDADGKPEIYTLRGGKDGQSGAETDTAPKGAKGGE